jgi:hypothetical protein
MIERDGKEEGENRGNLLECMQTTRLTKKTLPLFLALFSSLHHIDFKVGLDVLSFDYSSSSTFVSLEWDSLNSLPLLASLPSRTTSSTFPTLKG